MENFNALFRCCQLGKLEEVKHLTKSRDGIALMSSPHPTQQGQTPLHMVAQSQNVEVMSYVLGRVSGPKFEKLRKSLLDSADMGGWTPLHCAADSGNYQMCIMLLKAGADASLVSSRGQSSALHYLVQRSPSEDPELLPTLNDVMSKMVENGCEVNGITVSGETALHNACLSGHYNAVKALVECKADYHMPSAKGETPLHYACRLGYSKLVDLLLSQGVDETVRGAFGTAEEVAREAGQMDIAEKLKGLIRIRGFPVSVMWNILRYLSVRDLLRVCHSCKALRKHGRNDMLWRHLYRSHYDETAALVREEFVETLGGWMPLYVRWRDWIIPNPPETPVHTLHLLLLGDSGVGKHTFLSYLRSQPCVVLESESSIAGKDKVVLRMGYSGRPTKVVLAIPNQNPTKRVLSYKQAHGLLILFDETALPCSFNNVKAWAHESARYAPNALQALVSTHMEVSPHHHHDGGDDESSDSITHGGVRLLEEQNAVIKEMGLAYRRVDCKTGYGVCDAVRDIMEVILEHRTMISSPVMSPNTEKREKEKAKKGRFGFGKKKGKKAV